MAIRYSICSEIFKDWRLRDMCRVSAALGYTGLELAPFMFAEDVRECSAARRAEMRREIEGESMVCSGMHWLLASPKGLHITTNDAALRERSWDYLARLIDFCGDLGGTAMILGSPHQRSARDGWTVADATQRLIEGLRRMGPIAAERGVNLMIEAVSSKETNVVTTLGEAAAIVDAVGHPNIQTMFDFHNAADEGGDYLALLERHYSKIRHVHLNEADGRHPGTGEIDFASPLKFLRDRKFTGWISLEVFDFSAGAETIARESINFLRAIEEKLTAPNP